MMSHFLWHVYRDDPFLTVLQIVFFFYMDDEFSREVIIFQPNNACFDNYLRNDNLRAECKYLPSLTPMRFDENVSYFVLNIHAHSNTYYVTIVQKSTVHKRTT